MHHSQAATHHRFCSHPPLPPHPLLELHRSATDSPQHRHASPGLTANIPVESPRQNRLSPRAENPTPSRPADNGPSRKGHSASSPDGTAQAECPSRLSGAWVGKFKSSGPAHHSKEGMYQEQLQQPKPQTADLQQHELLSVNMSTNDDDRQRLRQVAASQGQEQPYTDQQDQSDSDSQHPELSVCESAGAVGDDELLDHEPEITKYDANAQGAPADQPGLSVQLWPGRQHRSPPFYRQTAMQHSAVSNSKMSGHSRVDIQHQQEARRAPPHNFVGRGFGQQQRPVAYPQHWPIQAVAPLVRHGQMQPGSGRGRQEEHVVHQGSKLCEAYTGDPVQESQCQAEVEQQHVQHNQRHHSGNTSLWTMSPLQPAALGAHGRGSRKCTRLPDAMLHGGWH